MGRKLINALLVLTALFFCPLFVIVAAGGTSLVFGFLGADLTDMVFQVGIPDQVAPGDNFSIRIKITNTGDAEATLNSIDLYHVEGDVLEVIATRPRFEQNTDGDVFQTFWFDEQIPAGETLEVSLIAVVDQRGVVPIEIDICINQPFNCMLHQGQIIIR